MNNSFTWEPLMPHLQACSGVYLLVFRGTPKRVIYVGQTKKFVERIEQHQKAFSKGERNIWRVEREQDIYELMSYNGEKQSHRYYASLAKKGLLWATADRNKERPSNDLYPSDDFEKNWLDFVWSKYINNIEVWVCRTPNNEELRLRLESQIQNLIMSHYSIGSHIHHHVNDMCFLGKVELPDMTSGDPYTFTNAPDISEEFTQLLHNQLDRNSKKYIKPAKALKKAEVAENLKTARETYIRAGDPWTDDEKDWFFTLLHKDISLNAIAKEFLFRTPKELEVKHKTLSRDYKMPKIKYK